MPLQSWLGDAMEGPTPVSALIHAATMVTAGVYLIVRSGPIFNAAPTAQTAVVIVGAVTLLFGAIIGCAKDDIKKALAASTMSQIGYMVLAAGLGPAGYAVAIMHLLTHGFFKAGLFLGAGSVMHAMGDETDMRRYGELRKLLPITFVTFGLGYLAIIGVPPFAGFFSKDAIIETAFNTGGLRGLAARRRGPARCRHHRVLHDQGHAADLLRPGPLDREGHRDLPARIAGGDDLADDRAGGGFGRRRRGPGHRAHPAALAGTRCRQPRNRTCRARLGADGRPRWGWSPSVSRSPTGCTRCTTWPRPRRRRCPP